MPRLPILVLAVLTLLVAATGYAEPAAAPAGPAPPAESASGQEWYGGPAVLSDVGSLALVVAGAAVYPRTRSIFYLGLGTYLLGGPINHFDNGNTGGAALGFGVRALALAASVAWLSFASHARGCGSDSPTASCDLLLLAPVPVLAATVIDDWLLARTSPPPGRDRKTASSTGISPGMLVTLGGASVSLMGSF